MRIIGGAYRGKKLFSPATDAVRPTSDRAREAVFNILNSKIGGDWGAYCLLELFAGTGAFALEALSRGVAEVCLVDINPENALRNTVLFTKEKERILVRKGDARCLPKAGRTYNLLFTDAPYSKGLTLPALKSAAEQKWLASGCLCVMEIEKNEDFSLPDGFVLSDIRDYGIARFVFAEYYPR